MRKMICNIVAVMLVTVGCSKEDREEVIERVGTATKSLAGDLRTDPVEPHVVKEAKRKESLRQDREWTPENQAAYPIEYCLAQQEETLRISKSAEVQVHRLRIARNGLMRELRSDDVSRSTCIKVLEELKARYRESDASNSWPVVYSGYSLSKDKVRSLIVDLSRKVVAIESMMPDKTNRVSKIDRKIIMLEQELKRLSDLRERLRAVVTDIRTSRICEDENGIGDVLNTINDSLKSLSHNVADVSADDLCVPLESKDEDEEFISIMEK